jgi:hypothetical protein
MMQQKEIVSAIAEIGTAAGTLRDKVQVVAVSVIGHAFFHGDVTLADKLMDALGRATDRQALVHYFEDHGPFRWEKAQACFKLNKKFRDEHQFDEASLTTGVKWYEYGRSKKEISSSFDLVTRAKGLIKSLAKAEAEGKEVDNAEFARYLQDAITSFNRDRAEAMRKIADGQAAANSEPAEFKGQAPELARTGTEG